MTDEVIVYDPEDIDTYPSICSDPESVKARFGWTGGEEYTQREIDLWFMEGEPPKACRTTERERRDRYDDLPYEIRDPKHPDHHAVMADIWDSREGK